MRRGFAWTGGFVWAGCLAWANARRGTPQAAARPAAMLSRSRRDNSFDMLESIPRLGRDRDNPIATGMLARVEPAVSEGDEIVGRQVVPVGGIGRNTDGRRHLTPRAGRVGRHATFLQR